MVPEHWKKSFLETPLLQQITNLLPSQISSIPKSSGFNCRSTKTSPAYLHRLKEILMGLHLSTNINGQLINALFSLLLNRWKRQLLLAEKPDLTLQLFTFYIASTLWFQYFKQPILFGISLQCKSVSIHSLHCTRASSVLAHYQVS